MTVLGLVVIFENGLIPGIKLYPAVDINIPLLLVPDPPAYPFGAAPYAGEGGGQPVFLTADGGLFAADPSVAAADRLRVILSAAADGAVFGLREA